MPCQCGSLADSLPLLVVSGGKKDTRRDILESVLRYLDSQSLATLLLSRQYPHTAPLKDCGENICQFIMGANFWRDFQGEENRRMLVGMARRLVSDHDLVVTEAEDGGEDVCIELFNHCNNNGTPIFDVQPGDQGTGTLDAMREWLVEKTRRVPVWGCLLIGGKSRRMGRPKHLITDGTGATWVEQLVGKLSRVTQRVVLAGKGDLPEGLGGLTRLEDIDDSSGPLAGILAAMRWKPEVSWIVCACDMPFVEQPGFSWLLNQRRPGVWGSVPYQSDIGRYQPLLAYYDRRAKQLFEKMVVENTLRIGGIVAHQRIITPSLPEQLKEGWRNCNTPTDLGPIS